MHRLLSGIIDKADASGGDDAGEEFPGSEHVIHRHGCRGMARQLFAHG